MIAEVKEALGRTGDTTVLTDARVNRWLNEAQRIITKECPGLLGLDVSDTTITMVTDTFEYDFPTTKEVCHPIALFVIDGTNSYRLKYLPKDEFDIDYLDMSSSDVANGKPECWTQKNYKIHIGPKPSSDYNTKSLRFDYTAYPDDIATDDTSDLTDADEGLLMYAEYKGWKFLKLDQRAAVKYMELFGPNYENGDLGGWLGQYKRHNDLMLAWDGNLYD